MKQIIADRIRFHRLVRSLSQENMANELNISVATYSNIERAVTDITITRLAQICEILGLSMVEILEPKQVTQGSDKESPGYLISEQYKSFLLTEEISQMKNAIEQLQKELKNMQNVIVVKQKTIAKKPNRLK